MSAYFSTASRTSIPATSDEHAASLLAAGFTGPHSDEEILALVAALPPVQEVAQEPVPYPVTKDTIIQRIKAAGKLGQLATMIANLPADQQFEFTQSAWFMSNNPQMIGGCQYLGLDPAVILAVDENPWLKSIFP